MTNGRSGAKVKHPKDVVLGGYRIATYTYGARKRIGKQNIGKSQQRPKGRSFAYVVTHVTAMGGDEERHRGVKWG